MNQGNQPPLRVAVIGARRVRQGIGEFVARWFASAGAEVCAVVGSAEDTAAQAASNLASRYAIETEPFATLEQALDQARPDAVAICSPHVVHLEHLQATLDARVHCLCEKPMWWPPAGAEPGRIAETTRELVHGFDQAGRVLGLITQWPCTLEGFFQVYPELSRQIPTRFEMELGPVSLGPRAVLDSVPHVISMLHALVGSGRVRDFDVDSRSDVLSVSWLYQHGAGEISTTCRLVACPEPPRPAAYAIDGHRVDRRIALPEYTILLEGGGQQVPLEDPLAILIRQFMNAVETGSPMETVSQSYDGPRFALDACSLIESMTALESIHRVVVDALGDG